MTDKACHYAYAEFVRAQDNTEKVKWDQIWNAAWQARGELDAKEKTALKHDLERARGTSSGVLADLRELIRVALTNPSDLRGFIQVNYPKEYQSYPGRDGGEAHSNKQAMGDAAAASGQAGAGTAPSVCAPAPTPTASAYWLMRRQG